MQTRSKRSIMLTAVAFCMMATAQAQLRTVAVSVELKDVTGVSPVQPAGSNAVDFSYQTAADYNGDKSTTVTDQFRVTSTVPYNILVRGAGDFTGTASGTNTLPLSILKVSAKATGAGSFSAEVTPTTSNVPVVTGASATLDQGYDVLYRISQNPALLTATKDKYVATLTYTATAQ